VFQDSLPIATSDETRTNAKRVLYRRNINRFFSEQLVISTKGIGYQPFTLNPVQIPIAEAVNKQIKETGKIRQLWFKCRQAGGSTLASGFIWNKTSLFSGVNAFIVAQDKTTVKRIFNMHDLFYRNMDKDIRPLRQYFTKGTEIVLGSDSTSYDNSGIASNLLVGEAKNINLGVGSTIHCLHLSEIARYPSESPLTESLFPACSDFPGTIRIIESTAHFGGCADYFRDQCQRAMSGRGEYQFHFMQWWKLPEYSIPLLKREKIKLDYSGDYPNEKHLVKKIGLTHENIKWRRSKIDEYKGDVDLFYLSYPTDFDEAWITKDASAFPYGRLTEMQSQLRPPKKRFSVADGKLHEDPEGLLYVWRLPEKDKVYDIGADIAGGDGSSTDGADGAKFGDYSVAEIVSRGTLEQCAEWRGHILPRAFGDVLAAVGRFYNNAQVAPELNTFGMSTLERLRETYSNIYIWRKRDGISMDFTKKLGWVTGYESKNVLVNTMREKLYYRQTVIHSKTLWDEMRNFVKDLTPTGMITYHAATGYDDCCMGYLIAVQTSEDENFERFYKTSVSDTTAEKPKAAIDAAYFDSEGLHPVGDDTLNVDTGSW